jgi:hypothetical protein
LPVTPEDPPDFVLSELLLLTIARARLFRAIAIYFPHIVQTYVLIQHCALVPSYPRCMFCKALCSSAERMGTGESFTTDGVVTNMHLLCNPSNIKPPQVKETRQRVDPNPLSSDRTRTNIRFVAGLDDATLVIQLQTLIHQNGRSSYHLNDVVRLSFVDRSPNPSDVFSQCRRIPMSCPQTRDCTLSSNLTLYVKFR